MGDLAKRKQAEEAWELIRSTFPKCFTDPKRPLKVGIFADIKLCMPEMKSGLIRQVIVYYVDELSYQNALTEGAVRVDLDGACVGVVTGEESKQAAWRALGISETRATKFRLGQFRKVEKAARVLVSEGVTGLAKNGGVVVKPDLHKALCAALEAIAPITLGVKSNA